MPTRTHCRSTHQSGSRPSAPRGATPTPRGTTRSMAAGSCCRWCAGGGRPVWAAGSSRTRTGGVPVGSSGRASTPTWSAPSSTTCAALSPRAWSCGPTHAGRRLDGRAPSRRRGRARRAHVADLTGGLPAVMAACRRSPGATCASRSVRRPGGGGPDGRLLPVFHRLYELSVGRGRPSSTSRSRWRSGGPPPGSGREVRRHRPALGGPVPAVRRLRRRSARRGRLVLFGQTARYMRGAMDRDLAAPSRANDALHLAAIERACAAGCTRYHFGETGTSESLARFKGAVRRGAGGPRGVPHRAYPITALDRSARAAVKGAALPRRGLSPR